MSKKIRSAALVLVLSVLFVSSAYALPLDTAAVGPRTGGFLPAVWDWLTSFVLPAAPGHTFGVTAASEKAGSSMDPNGNQNILLPGSTTDMGSPINPDGYK